jgi:putative DNA primase/helicase
MNFAPDPSWPTIVELATALWGHPNKARSTRTDIRFGLKGSKSVKPASNLWFDFESNQGGGYIALWKLARPSQPLPHINGETKPWQNIDIAYDYDYEDGTLAYQVIRTISGSPRFLQRRPNGPNKWLWKLDGVGRIPYHLPELLAAAPGSIVYIAEGEKDVDRLRGHGKIATCNPGGAAEHKNKDKPYRGKWLAEHSQHLRGHHVRILPDNDAPGEAHALDIARKLHGVAASVRIVRLPDLQEKGDVSDWLNSGHTIQELDRLADEAEDYYPEKKTREARDIVQITKGEYPKIAVKLEAMALAAKLAIYHRSGTGELCRPIKEQRKRHDDRIVAIAILKTHNVASLRRTLDEIVAFANFDGRSKDLVSCEVPADILHMVLEGSDEQIFPVIRGIIATPILRPDGTIITEAGFDDRTGYYLVDPPEMPPITAAPTREDAQRALDVLDDLLSEFPFVDGPNETGEGDSGELSRSVAYSGLITPLVRAACGVVPGHLFTAPKQGSGKSLLVDLASAIATGEPAYAILFHEKLPEEMDKQLASAVLEGRQIIALDNITGEITSAVLSQATEREQISVRPFGKLISVAIVNSFNTYITGNNVIVAGDNARRLLVARVDPQVENPLDRTFKKENPLRRILAERGKYVAAILTIVLAYLAAKRPSPLPPTPSYDAWSRFVREPLVWLGLPDPTDSMRASLADDPGNAALAALMDAWPTGQTDWTAAELIEAAQKFDDGEPKHPRLAEALRPIACNRRGLLDATVLGVYLRQDQDKIVAGRKITRHAVVAHGGAARWVRTSV